MVVKKSLVSALVVVVCAGLFGLVMTASGQGTGNTADSLPHKIALVDMAEVFQKYKKFENLRESLKSEI